MDNCKIIDFQLAKQEIVAKRKQKELDSIEKKFPAKIEIDHILKNLALIVDNFEQRINNS